MTLSEPEINMAAITRKEVWTTEVSAFTQRKQIWTTQYLSYMATMFNDAWGHKLDGASVNTLQHPK